MCSTAYGNQHQQPMSQQCHCSSVMILISNMTRVQSKILKN